MPYRALLWTLLTVTLALAAVALWMDKVAPLLAAADAQATTEPAQSETAPAATAPSTTPTLPDTHGPQIPSEKKLRWLTHGTLLLSFVLICMLLIVGLAGAFREWMRYRLTLSKPRAKPAKTAYVDAWKIAGERMKDKQPPLEDEAEEP